jgi:hypothetical protein
MLSKQQYPARDSSPEREKSSRRRTPFEWMKATRQEGAGFTSSMERGEDRAWPEYQSFLLTCPFVQVILKTLHTGG